MKEILFKAKVKDWRERPKKEWWVYGDAIHELIGMTIKHMEHGMPVRVPVDPETLCQYICMNDKNGNWIWENDIVLCKSGETVFSFNEIILVDDIANYLTMSILTECKDLEVLGNRFDNPELLSQCINFLDHERNEKM